MPTTLIIDTGQNIVGVYSVEHGNYTAYCGEEMSAAIERIASADEVVTYNGNQRDLLDLAKVAGTSDIKLLGRHSDMREVCWGHDIWGSDLETTYLRHFPEVPSFPLTYEGDNQRDIHMTLKLWALWRDGKLKVHYGPPYTSAA